MKTQISMLLLLCSVAGGMAAGENWPSFRGPDGSGIAVGAHPPVEWSDSKSLAWKTVLPGPGASSPIRVGDNLFVTCYSGFGVNGNADGEIAKLQRHLLCLDASNGKIRWDATVIAEPSETRYTRLAEHGYASHTPAADGERVYAFFGKSGVHAFDLNGKEIWKADVGSEAGRQGWGSAASLVLYKNLVIVNAADESQSIRGLDRATGREIWRADGTGLVNVYNTPTLVTLPDGHQELVVALQNEVWGLNPDNGKVRWFAQVPIASNMAASTVAADGVVYAFGGNRSPGTVAIRAGGKGDVTKTHVLWNSSRGPDFGTPVIQDGFLYYANSRGVAVCLNAKTGEQVYEERLRVSQGSARTYASPVLADGKLYLTTRTSGTIVLAAKPAFAQLGENVVSGDRTDFSGSPMITGNQIFLRSNQALYCFTSPDGNGRPN